MTTQTHFPVATATVRTTMPLEVRWKDLVLLPDQSIATISYVWCTGLAWERFPESRSAGWQVMTLGAFVLARRTGR